MRRRVGTAYQDLLRQAGMKSVYDLDITRWYGRIPRLLRSILGRLANTDMWVEGEEWREKALNGFAKEGGKGTAPVFALWYVLFSIFLYFV